MKRSEHEKVSECLYVWFMEKRHKGLPVSGVLLKSQAMKFYEKLENTEGIPEEEKFTASDGWLSRWKKRYGVRELKVSGEKLSAINQMNQLEKFKRRLLRMMIRHDLQAEQIYNADETGLYYRMLPDKTLASKEEKAAPGYKKSKDRVTLMACSNVTGDHKLKPVLIGKSKNPRVFSRNKIDKSTLPVWYENQKSAWMSAAIFEKWFKTEFVPEVKKFLKSKNLPEKALLIVDNARCHPQKLSVRGIEMIFFPPNITSIGQPMDQGVLESYKRKYRKLLLDIILSDDAEDDYIELLKKIDMLDVVRWSAQAWNEVAPVTIVRSWRKVLDHRATDQAWGNFANQETDNLNDAGDLEEVVNAEMEENELVELLQKIPECRDFERADIREWMHKDDDIELADDDIVQLINEEQIEDESDEDEPDETDASFNISHAEGFEAIEKALNYMEQQSEITLADRLMMRRWRDIALKKKVQAGKQKTITDFFKK